MTWLMLVADRTGINKLTGVFLQGGPPEPVLQALTSPLDTSLPGESGERQA